MKHVLPAVDISRPGCGRSNLKGFDSMFSGRAISTIQILFLQWCARVTISDHMLSHVFISRCYVVISRYVTFAEEFVMPATLRICFMAISTLLPTTWALCFTAVSSALSSECCGCWRPCWFVLQKRRAIQWQHVF